MSSGCWVCVAKGKGFHCVYECVRMHYSVSICSFQYLCRVHWGAFLSSSVKDFLRWYECEHYQGCVGAGLGRIFLLRLFFGILKIQAACLVSFKLCLHRLLNSFVNLLLGVLACTPFIVHLLNPASGASAAQSMLYVCAANKKCLFSPTNLVWFVLGVWEGSFFVCKLHTETGHIHAHAETHLCTFFYMQ